jgi:hypothetical protein
MKSGANAPICCLDCSLPLLNLCYTRMVVRIMLMVPIYAVSSLISLFSLEAAFVIDAIRDIYEVRRSVFHYPLDYNYFLGIRNLLLFPTIARIPWWRALVTHSCTRSPTQSPPFSGEYFPTRARCQRPLHILILETRNSSYVLYCLF